MFRRLSIGSLSLVLLAVVLCAYVVSTSARGALSREARAQVCRTLTFAWSIRHRPLVAIRRSQRTAAALPFGRALSALEIWLVRPGLQIPMRDTDLLEVRVYVRGQGMRALASLDTVGLRHLLGSHLFLAQAQAVLREALEAPDAKAKLEELERALPLPRAPLNAAASRAASERDVREALRGRRRTRKRGGP